MGCNSSFAIKLYSGEYFDLKNPETSLFSIEDIAHALANLCRYNGHCTNFYSVAQHSVLVSKNLPVELALQGLMHDAAEAFIGDVASPLKQLLPEYKVIENRVECTIRKRLGLPIKFSPIVKELDLILLRTEQRDVMNVAEDEWILTKDVLPLSEIIEPLPTLQAKNLFIERFLEINPGYPIYGLVLPVN